MDLELPITSIKKLVVLSILLASCLHTENRTVPIERSKYTAPTWISLPTNQLFKEAGRHFIIYKSESKKELKQSIKSAETQAIKNFCSLASFPCTPTISDIYYEKTINTKLMSYNYVIFVYVIQKSY